MHSLHSTFSRYKVFLFQKRKDDVQGKISCRFCSHNIALGLVYVLPTTDAMTYKWTKKKQKRRSNHKSSSSFHRTLHDTKENIANPCCTDFVKMFGMLLRKPQRRLIAIQNRSIWCFINAPTSAHKLNFGNFSLYCSRSYASWQLHI